MYIIQESDEDEEPADELSPPEEVEDGAAALEQPTEPGPFTRQQRYVWDKYFDSLHPVVKKKWEEARASKARGFQFKT
jgi:hypothetical protein